MARILAIVALFACLAATTSARCAPWRLDFAFKSVDAQEMGVYRMCGDDVCPGDPILKLGTCTEIGCPIDERCNDCSASLSGFGMDDLPEFSDGKGKVGRYGVQFDGETCPFLTFGSDFRDANSCGGGAWFKGEGWIAGCKPRVSCRTRGGKKCRDYDSPFDVSVRGYAGYTSYYGLGNAESLDECIAGNIGGGVPSGEVLGVDCPNRFG